MFSFQLCIVPGRGSEESVKAWMNILSLFSEIFVLILESKILNYYKIKKSWSIYLHILHAFY